jgi:hypothetical protein
MLEAVGYVIIGVVIIACLSFVGSSLNDENGHD